MKTLNSLKSRGYVKEQFAWRHYYWYLTNEGIQYLRDYLHLPPEIVPSTLKRQARAEARPRPSAGPGGPRSFGDKPDGGDRAAYRRAPGKESYFFAHSKSSPAFTSESCDAIFCLQSVEFIKG